MKYQSGNNKSRKNRLTRYFWLFCSLMLAGSLLLFFLLNNTNDVAHFTFNKTIPVPEVDIPSMYVDHSIQVNVINPKPQYKVYYTLDGTTPNSTNALLWKGESILITETVEKDTFLSPIPTSPRWQQPLVTPFCYKVFRAVYVNQNGQRGAECIKSYIIDPSKTHHYSIPIASIVFEPNDFFGYKEGIYVMGKTYEDKNNYIKKRIHFDIPWWRYPSNYLDKGSSSDRNVFVEFLDINSNCSEAQSTKMRIHGFNTRGFAQKSLRFKYSAGSRKDNCIPFFENLKTTQNYVFRNGGNDWTGTLLRDAFVHEIMKKSSLSAQAYQPVVCFFNGEYWGVHTLRERFDGSYIENKYGISKDSIAILELDGRVLEGGKSDASAYKNLVNFIQTSDMSDFKNYAVVKNELDLDNLVDYYLTNLFFVNNDWPQNNCKYWRFAYALQDTMFRDAKWRFVLYDMDWSMGFNINKAYEMNMFDYLKKESAMGKVLGALIKNKEFKQLFQERANILMQKEFSSENLIKIITRMESELDPLIQEHIDRWRVIGSKTTWYKNVEDLKIFVQNRPAIFKKQLELFLNQN
jgi:hypothetical protein